MSDVSSLDEALKSLEKDLFGGGGGIAAQSGIPFAILRYAPGEEFTARRRLRLLGHEMEDRGMKVCFISISKLVWKAILETDGVDYMYRTERQRNGVVRVQNDLRNRLKPDKPFCLATQIVAAVSALPHSADVVFLVRTGGIAPQIYRSSSLLHELQMAGYAKPTILCYPGSATVGTDLRFYDLPEAEGLGSYNYRVKIYGTN